MVRVLVSKHIYPEAIERLRAEVEVDHHDSDESLSPGALRSRIAGAAGLVCQLTDHIDGALLRTARGLKVVANIAVGHDNIDLDAARGRGIVVTNTPGVLTETTADLAFCLLLAAARRVGEAERYLRAGRWKQWRIDLLCGRQVSGATLGLVGFGRIGAAVARRARGFDMAVLFCDPGREGSVDLGELLERSDFVSLHLPLGPTTRHLVGAPELRRMKRSAILINTARGEIVDESALADALEAGEIAGAALDVYENEPAVEPRLLEREDVVLVPHIASASVATRTRMCLMAVENCLAVLRGEPAPNAVS